MANPQLENGYFQIANELMAAWCKLDISGAEFKILLTVIAKTYGWHKKEDQISLSQFQKLTGMSRPRVIKAIRSLLQKQILGSNSRVTCTTRTYWIIKDYEGWKPGNRRDTSHRFVTRAGNSHEQEVVTQQIHTKDNTTKDTITKDSETFDFEPLWSKYPNKDGKKAALNHFRSSVKTDQDYVDIQKALDNYLQSDRVKKGFIKNGSTFFNNWRDWIEPPQMITGPSVFQQNQAERHDEYEKLTTRI